MNQKSLHVGSPVAFLRM